MNEPADRENPFIGRRQRSRNRNWLTLKVIVMSILLAGATWAGFWVWLGQDTEVAVFLGEWLQDAVLIVVLVFGVAALMVALVKAWKMIRPDNDSLADLLAGKDESQDRTLH